MLATLLSGGKFYSIRGSTEVAAVPKRKVLTKAEANSVDSMAVLIFRYGKAFFHLGVKGKEVVIQRQVKDHVGHWVWEVEFVFVVHSALPANACDQRVVAVDSQKQKTRGPQLRCITLFKEAALRRECIVAFVESIVVC